ncbi:MAG: hypothetical protein K2L64_00420, partial [Ureaplasma sp.]|nr:hypothetical protein [Ureaplasma sp.]
MGNDRKVSIGLDIGTSSIGFCVVDVDSKEILKRQSHIFKNIDEDGKKDRGNFRRSRRTLRRRRVRKDDFIKLVDDKYSNIFKFNIIEVLKSHNYNVYELSYKGLSSELSPDELFRVLYHRLSFRGVSYKSVGEKFDKYLSKEFYEIYKKYGKIRHHNIRSFDEIVINKIVDETKVEKFSIFKNEIDLRKIMSNCSYLNHSNFVDDYLSIFKRKRDGSKGPGSEKSPSNYGIYRLVDNKVQKVYDTIWEENIGFCCVFNKKNSNKNRNSENLIRSYDGEILPELSLLLSQLNSIKIIDHNNEINRLDIKDKKKIILEALKNNKNVSLTIIRNVLGVEKDRILGYPTTNDNQPNFQSFKRINYCLENGIINLEKYKQDYDFDFYTFIEDISYIDFLFSKY